MDYINFYKYMYIIYNSMHRQMATQTNRMFKHFSALLESVKNHVTQLKIHFQPFRSIAHNTSEMFYVILHVKHAIVHHKKIC